LQIRLVKRVGEGVTTLDPATFGGSRRRSEIQKYTRMHHFEKKYSKFFFLKGPCKNVWGPRENVSLGPAVALDGPFVDRHKPAAYHNKNMLTSFYRVLTLMTLIEQPSEPPKLGF